MRPSCEVFLPLTYVERGQNLLPASVESAPLIGLQGCTRIITPIPTFRVSFIGWWYRIIIFTCKKGVRLTISGITKVQSPSCWSPDQDPSLRPHDTFSLQFEYSFSLLATTAFLEVSPLRTRVFLTQSPWHELRWSSVSGFALPLG